MIHFEDDADIIVFVDDFTDKDSDVCGATYIVKGISGPWTSRCDLTPGHDPATRHEADLMCNDGSTRIRWSGGTNHAGGLTPYRNVETVTPIRHADWSSQI